MQRTRRQSVRGTAPEIKTLRQLESQLAATRATLHLERQKRAQADTELAQAERSLETVLATKDRVAR